MRGLSLLIDKYWWVFLVVIVALTIPKLWHTIWFDYIVGPPILDWRIEGEWATSPTNPEVKLEKIARWDIEGRIGNTQRISDPILPTIGEFPRAAISPMDIVILYGDFASDHIFQNLNITHEFRTAWFKISDQELGRIWEERRPGGEAAEAGGALHEHAIPLNKSIYTEMLGLTKGEFIRIKAWLVNIHDSELIHRTDTVKGNKGCELILIEDIEKFTP